MSNNEVTVNVNDAEFLSQLVATYIYQNKLEQNEYLVNLCKSLASKVGC